MNPENGICLSPLYDRAFDKGYIAINGNYEILLSSELKRKSKMEYYNNHFASIAAAKIILPKKYYPKKEFLQYHMDEVFRS